MAIHTTETGTAEAALLGEYWDSEALDNLWPEMMHLQFAEKKTLPGGVGKVIHFTRFERLRDHAGAPAGGLLSLSEASDTVLQPSLLSANEIQATVVQYGHGVLFSDFVLLTARFDLIDEALQQLGMEAGWWVDNYLVSQISIRGTNSHLVKIAGDVTAATAGISVTSTNVPTINDVYWTGTKMAMMSMKKFRTGGWVALGHPAALHHLKTDVSVTGWFELNKYTADNVRELKAWSIGRVAGIDIFETINGTRVASTALGPLSVRRHGIAASTASVYFSLNQYVTRFLSPGAYGAVNLEGGAISTYVKKLGSAGWRDLVNQRAGVGIKVFFGAIDLAMSLRAVELYSAVTGQFGDT